MFKQFEMIFVYFSGKQAFWIFKFENRIPFKPVLEVVCSLANYSAVYEGLNDNDTPISFFCVFFVSKGNILDFLLPFHVNHLLRR